MFVPEFSGSHLIILLKRPGKIPVSYTHLKAGKIEYRLDKTNIIHVPIGKASFSEEQLSDNFRTLIEAIMKARPSTLKGQYLKSITITPTMGPGVKDVYKRQVQGSTVQAGGFGQLVDRGAAFCKKLLAPIA